MSAHSIAFNRPETNCQRVQAARPVDLDFLARQTMGQKDLEAEVLRLFIRHVRECMSKLKNAEGEERVHIAHALKGSARGVGAFDLASAAQTLETDTQAKDYIDRVGEAVVEIENFLLRLAR